MRDDAGWSSRFVATDLIYPDRTGEIYYMKFNPAHRWFYAPAMRDDEIMLIKCYDSAEVSAQRTRAGYVPQPESSLKK